MRIRVIFHLIAIALLFAIMCPVASAAAEVTGTASYRERIALPADAVFEATLEDISRLDAPAVIIARTEISGPGQPPIAFALAYDPAKIDQRFTYGVRTRITAAGQLLFTSDTMHPVLTRGAPAAVAITMRKVAEPKTEAAEKPATDVPAGATLGTGSDAQPASTPQPQILSGMFVYLADAARLTECHTDRSYPVAMEGDFRRLERAYLQSRRAPGQPLMVTFEGSLVERPRMEGEGTETTAVVERFINVWPGELCERNRVDATLTNTYWRIVKFGDEAVAAANRQREPHMILRDDGMRFNATVGCNQMIGGYEVRGDELTFKAAASTMMACLPPLDQLEHRLAEMLSKTRRWHIAGQFLELSDAEGKPLALFQSVYMR